jgi:extracellular elastinolytic metalloproteinase
VKSDLQIGTRKAVMAMYSTKKFVLNRARKNLRSQFCKRLVFEVLEPRRVFSADSYFPPSKMLVNGVNFESTPSTETPINAAYQFLHHNADKFGLTPNDLQHSIVTDHYTDADTGITHIYLRQEFQGLEVAYANIGIHLLASGEVISASSSFIPGLNGFESSISIHPDITPVSGAIAASVAFNIPLAAGPIFVFNEQFSIDKTATLDVPGLSLDDIPARLHFVPTADGGVQLGWQLIVRTSDLEHWYDLSINATDGTILSKNDWVEHATYHVLPLPYGTPYEGSFQSVTDPYLPATNASPFGWHDTDGIEGAESTFTTGNNVDAHLDRNGDQIADPNGRPDGGPSLNFNDLFDPTLSPLENANAAVTNLFYWNNLLHDIHFQYGFTPAAGNFQTNNYGLGGIGNDAVQADAQDNADGGSKNNANFASPPDGTAPRMQMFEFDYTTPRRDSDMVPSTMTHEYGHGVSSRLTGGPSNANALAALQCRGMGEGWSDWWLLMFRQRSASETTNAKGIGMYIFGQPETAVGNRPYRYDFDIGNPTFESFLAYGTGTGQTTQVHAVGTRWASALWDINHYFIQKYGYESNVYNSTSSAGNIRALHLVMNALKLQPALPSFTQARDAILAADMDRLRTPRTWFWCQHFELSLNGPHHFL